MQFLCLASIRSSRKTIGRICAASFAHTDGSLIRSMIRCHTRNFFSIALLSIDEWATSVTFGARVTCGAAAPQRRRSKERNKKRKRGCTIKRRAWATGTTDRRRDAAGRPARASARSRERDRGCAFDEGAIAERMTIRISVVTRTARAFFFTDTPGWRRNHWLNLGADPFFPSRDLFSLLSPAFPRSSQTTCARYAQTFWQRNTLALLPHRLRITGITWLSGLIHKHRSLAQCRSIYRVRL